MGTPAVASAPQVPADSHGRQLRNLGRQRWYLPAVTVANAAGFESSGAVAALNKWIGKLKRNDAIPRDVEEYNVYPVDSRAEYYISGDEKLNSSTSIGIGFTLYEQKLAFSHLEQPQYRGMLKYGMGENDAALPADKDGWMALIVPLCCGYNDIFYLDTAPAVGASTAAAPRRRRAATQVAQTLKQMQACGALDLTDTQPVAPSRDHTKPDLPEAPPTSAPHAEPTAPSASAQQAPEIQMVPRIINFHSKEYKISKNGNEDRAYDDRTRIAVLRMKQSDVSDYEAPGLLVDILTLYGHVIEGEAPSRKFCSNMTPEGGVLAFCLIAQQLLDWGRGDEAVDVVTAEGDQGKQYAGQRVTASADGASIGEDKFIAVAMQKQVEVTHKGGAIQKVFRRVALPLIHLPEGSDERKQQALLDSMDDVVGSYNAICAEETGEDMSQYDIAKLIGYCCNDHAESVVANKFAPAIKKIMELVNGTKGEVLASLDASETHLIPATSDAIERYFGLASWLDSRNPNLTRQNHSYRVSMKETKVGSKLCELYRANPDRVSRMMYRGRHFALEFDNLMVTRKEQVLEERIAGYDNARLAKKKKDDTSAAELEKMRGEARKWTHRELTHRTGRQTNSVLAAGRTAVPTVTSLVAETRAARDGTDIQNNTAVEKMLVRWLTVFHKVHGLSEVPALQSIFYSRTSGHLCIKGDGAGGQKSELQLMENLAACSAYLKENGGADLFTDEPGQATGPSGGSEAPAGP